MEARDTMGPDRSIAPGVSANRGVSNRSPLSCMPDFYKHLGSRNELIVGALAAAFKDLDVCEEHTADMTQLLKNYLTRYIAMRRNWLFDGRVTRLARLGDMTRGSKSARALYPKRVKRSVAFSSALLPSNQRRGKRDRALLILSLCSEPLPFCVRPNLSRQILQGVREELTGLVRECTGTTGAA